MEAKRDERVHNLNILNLIRVSNINTLLRMGPVANDFHKIFITGEEFAVFLHSLWLSKRNMFQKACADYDCKRAPVKRNNRNPALCGVKFCVKEIEFTQRGNPVTARSNRRLNRLLFYFCVVMLHAVESN